MKTKKEPLYKTIGTNTRFAVRYFVHQYDKLPSIKTYRIKVNNEELCKNLKRLFPELLSDIIQGKEHSLLETNKWEAFTGDIFCHIKEGLVLQSDSDGIILCHDCKINGSEIEKVQEALALSKEKKKKRNNKFSMIKKSEFGVFFLSEFKIKKHEISICENYNDELVNLNPQIIEFINSKDNNGIILFHGEPGGGKTSYIRSLISSTNSRFIYVPNNLFCHISDPEFIDCISTYPNSVIILEDCEELLKPREQNQTGTGISNLLNLGDGLLGDALKLKIICTFNSDLNKIDEALLRKGRLIYRYEFGPLEVGKVNHLLEKLEVNIKVTKPTTLAEVYNMSHNNNGVVSKKNAIGFTS